MLPRRESDLDGADAFLPLVLGMTALMRRFDRVLEMVPAVSPGEVVATCDPTVHLVLGLIAVRDRLYAHLGDAAEQHREPTARITNTPFLERQMLLR